MTWTVAVAGAGGRMGQEILQALEATDDLMLGDALERSASPAEISAACEYADALIDFSSPEGTESLVSHCEKHGTAMVIGTTGLSEAVRHRIESASQHIPIVVSANMSVGINVLLRLVQLAAQALDTEYDAEVFEAHHRHKRDAPSGTALALGEAIAAARNSSLDALADYARHGNTGPRAPGSIGFSVLRAGDIVGDHTVTFAGPGERIELTHRSSSRATYARGSLEAVRFLKDRKAGLYSMADVLGLR